MKMKKWISGLLIILAFYGMKLSDGDIEDIPSKMLRYINRDRI